MRKFLAQKNLLCHHSTPQYSTRMLQQKDFREFIFCFLIRVAVELNKNLEYWIAFHKFFLMRSILRSLNFYTVFQSLTTQNDIKFRFLPFKMTKIVSPEIENELSRASGPYDVTQSAQNVCDFGRCQVLER